MKTSYRANALACALLAGTALASPALAQSASQPSAYKNVDENGVDLTDGSFNFSLVEGSIGSGEGAIAAVRSHGVTGWTDNLQNIYLHRQIAGSSEVIYVVFGNRSERFSGPNFTADQGNGATLTVNTGGNYVYRAADGTQLVFGMPASATNGGGESNLCNGNSASLDDCKLLALSSTAPNANRTDFDWNVISDCGTTIDPNTGGTNCTHYWRLAGLSNSLGYGVSLAYRSNATPPAGSGPHPDWFKRASLSLNNLVAGGTARTVSYAYPAADVTEVTDPAGRTWRFSGSGSSIAIRRPGSASDNISVALDANGRVSSVTRDGVTTGYSRSVSGSTATMTVTNPLGQQRVVTSDLNIGRPLSFKDELNRTTSFQYDANGRLSRTTAPEGNYVQYAYDARGNVTHRSAAAKPGSFQSGITVKASYPETCGNPKTCNKPMSTTDPRGLVTDYSYDPTHGGLISRTAPVARIGVRSKTSFGYTAIGGVHLLTSSSACRTYLEYTPCAGTADEVKTTFGYDVNGNVTSVSSGAGDGSLTATRTMTYDTSGDLLTEDGPLAGSADTTRHRYNAAREKIGTISPDPDGAGALKHRAVRNVIDPATGLLTKVETGTVNSQSDADWAAFAPLEAVETGYDAHARPVTQKLTGGGTTHALTQTSYDALGRAECQAVRMNPDAFGSLPASACTQGTQGSHGPDRITRNFYNAAGEVVSSYSGYDTPSQSETRFSYRPNGQVETVTDAENNKTTYQYEGHDRLAKTFFPVATKGANQSSTTDYEELSYDSASNVTTFRNRAGQLIQFRYNDMNLVSNKGMYPDPSVTYGYDNFGRMTSASQGASDPQPAHDLSFTWDALGRKLSEAGPRGTISSQYDLAGRRTRLTHPDGFFVDHDYLVTGEMSRIRENGATSGVGVLATFAYDDLGRRTSLTRGNGTSTSYSYDNGSRLSQLVQDIAGTSHDLTLGFSYNPAGQIVSNTRSNDAYAWTGHGSGTMESPANGLNQLSSVGGAAVTHDAKGNLTYDPTNGYGYDYSIENLLTRVNAPTWSRRLYYDPLMRLYQPASVLFAYDGDTRIAEYHADGSGQTNRFVHGPGADEPLVEYGGTGLATRHFLHADERGSIIAASDSGGNPMGISRYDEYGRNQNFVSRFVFAGQPYESVAQLNYARARMYNPRLGRFTQPDPIKYADGMNMYAYSKADPINFTDPSGTTSCSMNSAESRICFRGDGTPTSYTIDHVILASFTFSEGGGGGDTAGQSGGGGRSPSPSPPSPTLRALARDSDVRQQMAKAWVLSNPYGPTSGKNEHGFWISQRGTDYVAHRMLEGRGNEIENIIRIRNRESPGATIFFHTHPFTMSERLRPDLSPEDFGIIQRNRIMMIAMSHVGHREVGFFEFDFRRRR